MPDATHNIFRHCDFDMLIAPRLTRLHRRWRRFCRSLRGSR